MHSTTIRPPIHWSRRWCVGALAVLAAMVAACGGDEQTSGEPDESADTSSAAAVEPETNSESDTEPEAGTDPQDEVDDDAETQDPDPNPNPDEAEVRPLIEVLGVDPSGDGWVLPPGAWTTPQVGTPITVSTSEQLSVIDNMPGLVSFGRPDFTFVSFDTFLYARFEGDTLVDPDTGEPSPGELPRDLESHLADDSRYTILDTGTLAAAGEEVPWWEIQANADQNDSFPCQYSVACGYFLFHDTVGPFQLGSSDAYRFRVAELPPAADGAPTFLWVQAPTEKFDQIWEDAVSVTATLRYEGPETERRPEGAGPVPLAAAGSGPLAVGTYTASISGLDLTLEVSEPEPDLFFAFAGPEGMIFDSEGFVGVGPLLGYLTPEFAKQTPTGPPSGDQVIAADADIGAHFEQLPGVIVSASGSRDIGGQPAMWWDIELDPEVSDDESFDCDGFFGPPGTRCVELVGSTLFGTAASEDAKARIYDLGDTGLVIVAEAPPTSFATFIEATERMLDGMRFEP